MTAPCRRSLCALCALGSCLALLTLVFRHLALGDLSDLEGGDVPRRSAKLDADRALAVAQSRTRVAICRALADGRLSLLEAATRLRACYRLKPRFRWDLFRRRYPGCSDAECFCREAIDYAVTLLHAPPERARALRQRLEAELSEALRHGPLRMPSPADSDKQEDYP
jgi:hypothetical protein